MEKLTGTGVALITPFNEDGSIDFQSLEKLVDSVIKGGVDYLVCLGTTGETPTLSETEKKTSRGSHSVCQLWSCPDGARHRRKQHRCTQGGIQTH